MAPVVQQMLAAAETAAGTDWGTIQGDLEAFAKTLVENSGDIAAKVAAGGLDDQEAADDLKLLGDLAAMLKDYGEVALQKVVQDAANAAIGVLVAAMKAAL